MGKIRGYYQTEARLNKMPKPSVVISRQPMDKISEQKRDRFSHGSHVITIHLKENYLLSNILYFLGTKSNLYLHTASDEIHEQIKDAMNDYAAEEGYNIFAD